MILLLLMGHQAAQTTTPMIPVREFLSGFISKATEPGHALLRNQEELSDFWTRTLGKTEGSIPKFKGFAKECLCAITVGSRPTSGYSVYVRGAFLKDNIAIVYCHELVPRPLAVRVQTISSPWVIARLPLQLESLDVKMWVSTLRYPAVLANPKPGKPDPDTAGNPGNGG